VIARRIGIALGLAVLCSSGAYVFVYLYRWEWNRALVAGVFFLSAEVALGFAAVLHRLHGMGPDPRVAARVRDARPEPRHPFAWLAPEGGQMSVFVPVLMGAGIVLSGIAWLVERLAGATAGPVLERGLARRLSRLALPEDGLLGRPSDGSLLDLR
jgi:hypothetical protein